MIVKPLTSPLIIRQLEALLKRLSPNVPTHIRQTIESDLAKYKSGYYGQKSLQYYLNFLDEDTFLILNDIRLPYKQTFFQIDLLLLTSSYVLILEAKNHSGVLVFEPEYEQMIQIVNGTNYIYPDPAGQVALQKLQLAHWLKSHRMKKVPIEANVMITNTKTKIETSSSEGRQLLAKTMIRSGSIPRLNSSYLEQYKTPILSKKELYVLADLIKGNDSPKHTNVLNYYKLSRESVRTGIFCFHCADEKMRRHGHRWKCSECAATVELSNQILEEYILLFDSEISNKDLRWFMELGSSSVANKFLKKMDLLSSGRTNLRTYKLQLAPA